MFDILIYFIIAVLLSTIMGAASWLLAIRKPESEKVSAYECGFIPFNDTRQQFEVRFFLIGILFIIFDLEISLLFPWALVLNVANYWMIIVFLVILTIGLIFEWLKGGLDWE